MEQMTVTAKIQISVNADSKVLLDKTMSVYSDACNFVSDHVFRTHDLKQFSLNKVLYSTLREKFGLKSQMAQSVFKTVIARYKTILENQNEWIQPSFKKPQYDLVWNRDYSLTQNCFSVNTLDGRVKLPYFSEGMSKYFNHTIYKFGTAKLVNKHGKYFLHIPVTYDVEESNISDICNVVGIDRGINFVVATYNSKHKSGFVSGKAIKQKRASYSKLRKELQMRQTPSSRRRLKAIGQRENRWMQDVNHQVSKALVESNPKHTLFVLEDLSGVRNATAFAMPQSVLGLKTVMFPYHGLFMTLNESLSIRLNRISLLLLRLTLVIQASVVLYVGILKKPIATRKYICLLVKTVATNLTMTALEL